MPRLIQISDCHIDDQPMVMGVNSQDNLKKIIQQISLVDFDALLISGDLTHNGGIKSYQILKEILLPIKKPMFVIAGNHDNANNLNQCFSKNLFESFTLGNWEIITIDSIQSNKTSGLVTQTALEKLDLMLLKSQSDNIIVTLHHPIVPMNSSWDDELSLENPQDLFQVLDQHSKIHTVVFGHAHEAAEFSHINFDIISCPSTALQFNQEQRVGYNEFNLNDNGTINHKIQWI
mgnify:FL=1